MKKAVNILMLMLVLIFSIQANVSFHYCHGKLVSATISPATEKGCCGDMDTSPENKSHEATLNSICCQNDSLQLSTDTYSHQYSEVKVILPFRFLADVVVDKAFDLVNPENLLTHPFYKPYWQIQADRGVDGNALICVFRI